MSVQRGKTSVLAKLGDKGRKALLNHKDDETKFPSGRLPKDIEGGIAQLTKCEFAEFKEGKHKGQPYFIASGVVVEPKQYAGSQTQIGPEALCETPERSGDKSRKTLDEHLEWVLNQLRMLGANTKELEDLDNLESVAENLVELGPHFKFRTWAMPKQTIVKKGAKWVLATEGRPDQGGWPTEAAAKAANPYAGTEPRVNETWLGNKGLEEYIDDGEAQASATEDESAATESEGGNDDIDTQTAEAAPWEGDDLLELAKAADKEDSDAQVKLQTLAESLEIDPDAHDNWKALAKAIIKHQAENPSENGDAEAEGEGDAEETNWEELGELGDNNDDAEGEKARGLLTVEAQRRELDPDDYDCWGDLATVLAEPVDEAEVEEELVPVKGNVYNYKPAGKKKAEECEVTMVLTKSKKVTCKSTDDGKVYKDVPWDKLSK